jgi:hypothetical protein
MVWKEGGKGGGGRGAWVDKKMLQIFWQQPERILGIFVGFSLKVSFDTARHVHVLAKYISYDEFNLVRPLVFFLCY